MTVALKDMGAREHGSRDSSTQNLVLWPPNGAINDPKRSSIATTLLKWQRITPKGKAKYRSFFRHYYFWLKNYFCAVVQKKVEKISSTVSFLF